MTMLKTQTWQEVEVYLKSKRSIIIPIGSYEQHGPNGLIATDSICPEEIAKVLGAQTNTMVGPTISVGVAQHHLGFSGSITLQPITLIAVMQDMVNSLAIHGFDHFLFLNGHGGNIATINAAFAQIHGERSFGTAHPNRPSLKLALHSWWECKEVGAYSNKHFPGVEGHHATPCEVSLTYFAYPDAVKDVKLDPEVAPDDSGIADSEDFRKRYPDGRIGSNPALATVAHGEALLAAGVAGAEKALQAMLSA